MYRLLFVLSVLSPFAFSQFNFQTIDISGATSTQVRGINSSNEIVGFYRTTALSSCTDYDLKVPNCPQHGFKIVAGVVTKLDVPNSISTAITGVNDNGDLVGFYQNSDGAYHGFLWLHTNVITTIDFPSTQFSTVPMGVNKSLTIAGGIWVISGNGTFAEGGLVWKNGSFRQVNLGTGCTNCTSINGISNNGSMAGQTFRNDFWNGFFKKGTDRDYWTFQNLDTFTTGVNNNTDVVGIGATTGGGWFAKHIELNEGTNDATEVPPVFLNVVDPLATNGTFPFGLNASRMVVGAYRNSTGMHGFIAMPTF